VPESRECHVEFPSCDITMDLSDNDELDRQLADCKRTGERLANRHRTLEMQMAEKQRQWQLERDAERLADEKRMAEGERRYVAKVMRCELEKQSVSRERESQRDRSSGRQESSEGESDEESWRRRPNSAEEDSQKGKRKRGDGSEDESSTPTHTMRGVRCDRQQRKTRKLEGIATASTHTLPVHDEYPNDDNFDRQLLYDIIDSLQEIKQVSHQQMKGVRSEINQQFLLQYKEMVAMLSMQHVTMINYIQGQNSRISELESSLIGLVEKRKRRVDVGVGTSSDMTEI
jgi:hypothetical protein